MGHRPKPWGSWGISLELLILVVGIVVAVVGFGLLSQTTQHSQRQAALLNRLHVLWLQQGKSQDWDDAFSLWQESVRSLVGLEPPLDLAQLRLPRDSEERPADQLFEKADLSLTVIKARTLSAVQGYLTMAMILIALGIFLVVRREIGLLYRSEHQARWNRILQDEHSRIARELHDGVAQNLARARLLMSAAIADDPRNSQEALRAVEQSLEEVRWLCESRFRQAADTEASWSSWLLSVVDAVKRRHGLSVDLQVLAEAALPWSPLEAHNVARILQEGLVNVSRHAHTPARVHAVPRGDGFQFTIDDDGPGLQGPPGLGMKGILERVSLLGGTVRWESRGPGTRMVVVLPKPGLP